MLEGLMGMEHYKPSQFDEIYKKKEVLFKFR
jgi:hypothetical protein